MLFHWKTTFEKKIIWVFIYSIIHNEYFLPLTVQKKKIRLMFVEFDVINYEKSEEYVLFLHYLFNIFRLLSANAKY